MFEDVKGCIFSCLVTVTVGAALCCAIFFGSQCTIKQAEYQKEVRQEMIRKVGIDPELFNTIPSGGK